MFSCFECPPWHAVPNGMLLQKECTSSRGWRILNGQTCHSFSFGEGSRPIFAREEIMQASTERAIIPPVDDHRRIVAIRDVDPPRMSGSHTRYEPPSPPPPPRYSEGRSRDAYYVPEHRETTAPLPSHRDYGRSHRDYERPSTSGYERDRRDDRYERRGDDLRHELDLRRRDDRYPSHGEVVRTYERGRDYRGDSSSRDHDRGEPSHSRHHRRGSRDRSDERIDRIDRMERMERMERRPMMPQPSPPGSSERRRGAMIEDYDRGRRGEMRRSPSPLPPPPHGGRREHHLPPQEHFHAEHPPPPERFHPMKPWEIDPEYVPKGRSYFEHDNRDEMMRAPHRGRGMPNMRGGPMRGRGMMRGRPFVRGPMRGFMGGRATGRRGSYVPRGFYSMY